MRAAQKPGICSSHNRQGGCHTGGRLAFQEISLSQSKDQVARTRQDPMAVWADRTTLVKKEAEAERAASDAKTAKLRALRLAKEAADRESAANAPASTASSKRKRLS